MGKGEEGFTLTLESQDSIQFLERILYRFGADHRASILLKTVPRQDGHNAPQQIINLGSNLGPRRVWTKRRLGIAVADTTLGGRKQILRMKGGHQKELRSIGFSKFSVQLGEVGVAIPTPEAIKQLILKTTVH